MTLIALDEPPSRHPAMLEAPSGEWDEGPPRDPGWRDAGEGVMFAVEPAADGSFVVTAELPGGFLGVRFERRPEDRFAGFGVRSDAVERVAGVVENWVGEGPYQLEEYALIEQITPRWALRKRRDAAYYPVPWALCSAGYGVLIESPELSRFRFGKEVDGSWAAEVDSSRLALRVFIGDSMADVLAGFTRAAGRQPYPAAPWFLGPWIQTGHADLVPFDVEADIVDRLRRADAPVSAVETHMRRLPGGAHEGRRDAERRRTELFHSQGLASLTYLNPFVGAEYELRFEAAQPMLERRVDGGPYLFPAYIGGRQPPLTTEGQLDFTNPAAGEFFAQLAREAVEDGHDGWMEDFGEYTPPDAVLADGATGAQAHNTYPVRYHEAGARAALAAGGGRPLARFGRSGWTGAARHLPLVWGGDPTTAWGFDGLASAVIQGISAGLSGIAFWGSDIGGFFTLGDQELDRELLIRWIQFGALSPLMRTKAEGIAIPPRRRPQVWDADVVAHWRRWAKLHTQLSPYLMGAAAEYVETGLPLMRHLGLSAAGPRAAAGDQYLLGAWLLAAPVIEAGARVRTVHLPPGRWLDLWRSATYNPETGGLELAAPRWLRGGRSVTLPAPLEEIPLVVRRGAVIPLLPPGVWSLAAPRPDPDAIHLLAFPHGESATRFDRRGVVTSVEDPTGWRLEVDGGRPLDVTLQAAMPFEPARVLVTGGELDGWSFDRVRRVLRARFGGLRPVLRANP